MTILPSRLTTVGLNVPADSQVVPWGEMSGVSERRCQKPKGRFEAGWESGKSRRTNAGAFCREHPIEVPSDKADSGLHLMPSEGSYVPVTRHGREIKSARKN